MLFRSGLVDRCIRGDIAPHRRPEAFNYYLHVDPANGGDRYVAVLVAKEYYGVSKNVDFAKGNRKIPYSWKQVKELLKRMWYGR